MTKQELIKELEKYPNDMPIEIEIVTNHKQYIEPIVSVFFWSKTDCQDTIVLTNDDLLERNVDDE